ncbi:MAG: MFS transporter [Sphaerochaetaceae bacterium]|nr:MFS transporter [Sphaerochaetaceae bacterium]
MNDSKRSLRILSLTIIFFWASEYCHVPYYAPYLSSLGFAATMIGIITGIYGFTQLIVRIPMGIITDMKSSYKATILIGTGFTTLSSLGLIFAKSAPSILFFRMLAGIAASTWLAFTVLYNAYYRESEAVTAMTNVNAFNNAGKLIAFFLGLVTARLFGYRFPLVCSFLTGLVALILALNLKPIQMKRESFKLEHITSVITNPAVLVASLFGIVLQGYTQATVFSFTSAVSKELGANAIEIGITTLLYTFVQVVSAPYLGKKLLNRIPRSVSLLLGFLLLSLSALLVAFAPSVKLIYIAEILAGVGNLILVSMLMAIIVSHIPQEKQSTAMGFYQAIYGIGMASGPVMVGAIVQRSGYRSAYLTVTAICMLSALLSFILASRYVKK